MSSIKISKRIMLIVAMSCIGMIILAALQLNALKDSLIEDRREKTREHVEAAVTLVEHYGALEASGAISQGEAQEQALAALRGMRFGDNGYYFVYDFDGTVIGHGAKPELEGKKT